MSFKKTGLGEPCHTLARTALKCVLRGALRTYLKRNLHLFALVVVRDAECFPIYEAAASSLLMQRPGDFRFGNGLYVNSLKSPLKGVKQHVHEALKSRQAVIFIDDPDDIPSDLTVSADLVLELQRPSARHFQIAALHHGYKGLTVTDAQFLANSPLRDVDAAVRSRRPLPTALRRLKQLTAMQATSPPPRDTPAGTARSLDDMEGLGPARDWGLRLAADVRDWQAGKLQWNDIDRGALISGPPGCGKTSFAKALAASCGLPIVLGSASRWQASGHLGDYLKAMRKTFADARAAAPCILFLDEFDSFGSRDSLSADMDHADYRRQTINGLLECLDPSEGREGVIVIGATNYPDKIDPALLRPGRMETLIQIPLPDWKARVAILKQYLGSYSGETDWTRFALASEGMTGADLEKLAREIRREARRSGDGVPREDDVLRLLPPVTIFTDDEKRRIAVHEVGHAIVGTMLLNDELIEVLIRDRKPAAAHDLILGGANFAGGRLVAPTSEYLLARIATSLGGIAAEQIVFGNHSAGCGGAASSDLATATDMAFRLEYESGLGDTLFYIDGRDMESRQRMLALRGDMQTRVEAVLQRQHAKAVKLLSTHKEALLRLSERLARELSLSGEDLRSGLAPADRTSVLAARKRARAAGFS